MDDTDLRGLDLASAKEYVFAYAVDVKRLDKAIVEEETELERWKARLALAESKLAAAGAAGDPSMAALAGAARAKVEEEAGKIATLEAERAELRAKVSRMREQLPMIQARERSIDPDLLLAELQMMTGELLGESGGGTEPGGQGAAASEAAFAKLEAESKADAELDALKRRAADGAKP
jgi:outer membrane murein-binding lipoprotein Lpp